MDHKNTLDFDDYILVNFENGRSATFSKIKDHVSGSFYVYPKGNYIDNNDECWISMPLNVYRENESEMLHIRAERN